MRIFCKNSADGQSAPRRNHGCLWTILIFFVVYFVFCAIVGAKMGDWMSPSATLEDNTVYVIQMEGVLSEQGEEENPFAALMKDMPMASSKMVEKVGLDDLKRNLQLAREDERIKGVVLKGGNMSMGPASAKALRDMLAEYKQSGKFLIAYANTYGQMNYYVASMADKVYLNPTGVLTWQGLAAQKMYFKRLLDKVGVEMQILKVGTFKSAVEPFFRSSMSEADREQNLLYLNGIWGEMRAAVSASRHISEDELDLLANRCMTWQPQEDYVKTGLVDSLIYSQSLDSILVELMGNSDYKTITTSKLASVKRTEHKATDKIAVLYAEGEITDEVGEGIVGTKMVKQINKLTKEKNLKAVVMRVNSPGGSADASEQIWHALTLLQEKGIPVVVSMGDYAASGGYYISCEADYIFAEPTTLTGSIGIFGMIPSFDKIRDKAGLDIDGVTTHQHAALESNITYRGMSTEERALMQNMINRGYELFTSRCAQGRHMSQDAIKAIAEGRVWLGKDALRLGLVDELGNIDAAIAKAADLAELTDYSLAYYPEKKDFMTQMMELMDDSTEEERLYMQIKSFCSKPRIMMLMDVADIQ